MYNVYVKLYNLHIQGEQSNIYINISITHIAQVVKTVTATKFRHEPFQDFYEVFEEIGR